MSPVRSLLCVSLALALPACGGKRPLPEVAPETLWHDGLQAYHAGHCKQAAKPLQRLLSAVPSSDSLAAGARYYLAECEFADRMYLEASRDFRSVADNYSTSRWAPDALLRSGDAQAQLWSNPELDPEYGQAALTTYRELLARFPDSPAARRANVKLGALNEKFAQKEYRNGVFYFRLKAYDSAIIYFRGVVADYPQSGYAPLALLRLVATYRKIGYAEEMKETCEHLRRYYPATEGLSDACPPPDAAGGP